jgi:hypothetical protein
VARSLPLNLRQTPTGKFAEYQSLTEFRSKKRFPRKGALRNPYQPILTAWWTSAN